MKTLKLIIKILILPITLPLALPAAILTAALEGVQDKPDWDYWLRSNAFLLNTLPGVRIR